jgi:hypothetical protein
MSVGSGLGSLHILGDQLVLIHGGFAQSGVTIWNLAAQLLGVRNRGGHSQPYSVITLGSGALRLAI